MSGVSGTKRPATSRVVVTRLTAGSAMPPAMGVISSFFIEFIWSLLNKPCVPACAMSEGVSCHAQRALERASDSLDARTQGAGQDRDTHPGHSDIRCLVQCLARLIRAGRISCRGA